MDVDVLYSNPPCSPMAAMLLPNLVVVEENADEQFILCY